MASVWWGHYLKLRRADEHLRAIRSYGTMLREPQSDTFHGQFHSFENVVHYIHFMKAPKDPEESVVWGGILLGDFVHELSSLLDQMIYTLVTVNTKRPPRDETFFPIWENPNDWRDNVAHTLRGGKWRDSPSPLAGIPDDFVTVIEQVQPYNGRKRNDPLARLHWLWNTDKHKVVHTAAVTSPEITSIVTVHLGDGREMVLKDVKYRPGIELKPDTYSEVLRVRVPKNLVAQLNASRNSYVTVENPPLDVTFGERRLRTLDLQEMYDAVNDLLFFVSELRPN